MKSVIVSRGKDYYRRSSTSVEMRSRSGKVGCVPQSGEATNWRFLETPTNKLTHTTGGETRPKSVLQKMKLLKQDLHIASVFSSMKCLGSNFEKYSTLVMTFWMLSTNHRPTDLPPDEKKMIDGLPAI